jgi:uncharacterized protein
MRLRRIAAPQRQVAKCSPQRQIGTLPQEHRRHRRSGAHQSSSAVNQSSRDRRRRKSASIRQLSRAVNRSKLNSLDRRRRRSSLGQLRARRSTPNIQRSIQKNMSVINHDQTANQFTTEVDGHRAELDYTVADSVMTITHTRVPQAIGGRGVAAELMRDALKVAAARGWSINPACSYAAAYMRKHSQSADKRHIDALLDEALDESFPASDSPSVGGSS